MVLAKTRHMECFFTFCYRVSFV